MASKKNEVANTPAETAVVEGEVLKPLPPIAPKGERSHRASFASDNRHGGYMIRVEGPNANAFAKREVPVTRYDGTETVEKCDKLIWSGKDTQTGANIALYKFIAHPQKKDAVDEIPF